MLSRTKIDRTGAAKTRTGSFFVRSWISGWQVWISIAAVLLLGAVAQQILSRSSRDSAEPNSSTPGVSMSPAASPVELFNYDRSALEPKNEPAATSSTSPTAQRDVAVSTAPIQSLLEEADAVVKPLAFYEPPTEANWTDEQYQRLTNLREEFATALGGWNRNPSDPDYRDLWLQAQPIIDEQFETIFGVEAFSDQQSQAVHQVE